MIVQTDRGQWECKDPLRVLPSGVASLGCSGLADGVRRWIGWDLDVGHGKALQYDTLELALSDARRIRTFLNGRAEIRLSKSGNGVHVKHMFPEKVSNEEGLRFAKGTHSYLKLRSDPSPLGRQAFWLWSSKCGQDGFKLLAEHATSNTKMEQGRLWG